MHGVLGVMTALVMTAAPGEEGAAGGTSRSASSSWGRTFLGVAVPLAPGGFALEGEQEWDEGFTATLGLRVSEPSSPRLGLEPGARFYVKGSALEGMWFGPRLELARTWRDVRGRSWDMGGALLAGYSVCLRQGFTVQGALGVGATYRPPLAGFNSWTVTVGHRAQLSVGWSF
ncbi:hypothetical protein JQX13_14185 [Archangium violaceum]|uniref:hypothetical protein n=1 Tax=Archangium violaceum TaxID=83451 RepID=UPI00193B0B85|nr:hypothetical protein [Archangium violaceum]QRK11113.1 hypothetical protein JQX13_14185 [Archangium violaceum]